MVHRAAKGYFTKRLQEWQVTRECDLCECKFQTWPFQHAAYARMNVIVGKYHADILVDEKIVVEIQDDTKGSIPRDKLVSLQMAFGASNIYEFKASEIMKQQTVEDLLEGCETCPVCQEKIAKLTEKEYLVYERCGTPTKECSCFRAKPTWDSEKKRIIMAKHGWVTLGQIGMDEDGCLQYLAHYGSCPNCRLREAEKEIIKKNRPCDTCYEFFDKSEMYEISQQYQGSWFKQRRCLSCEEKITSGEIYDLSDFN